jgi:hypothetical protein
VCQHLLMLVPTTDWTIELVRTCHACKGTGKSQPPPRGPEQGQVERSSGPRPFECEICKGSRLERKSVSLEDLKQMLKL